MKRRIPITVTYTRRVGDAGLDDLKRVYPQGKAWWSILAIKLKYALLDRQNAESRVALKQGKEELDRLREEIADRRR